MMVRLSAAQSRRNGSPLNSRSNSVHTRVPASRTGWPRAASSERMKASLSAPRMAPGSSALALRAGRAALPNRHRARGLPRVS